MMYSENYKITLRQFKRLIVLDFFGIISLLVPYIIVNTAGYDGLLAILFGAIFLFVYFLIMLFYAKNIENDYLSFSRRNVGKLVTFLFSAMMLAKLLFSLVIVIKLFTEVISLTILKGYNPKAIVVPMVVVGAYLAYKGEEVRARFAEVLYFIILIPALLLLLFGLRNVELANLTPVFGQNISYSLLGGFTFFLLFNCLECILIVAPRIQPVRKRNAKPRSMFKSMISYGGQGLLFVVVLSLLFFVLTVGAIGERGASASMWSTISIIQLLEFPSSIVSRQDSLFLALWLISIFSLISGLLYYCNYYLKDMFMVKKEHYTYPFLATMVSLLAFVPINLELLFKAYMWYITYIGLPQSILLPLIVIIVHRLRTNKGIVKSKALIMMAICAFSMFYMNGCATHVEIEQRDFVQVVGLDYVDGQLTAQFVLPDLGKETGGEAKSPEDLVKTFRGENMYVIEEQYKACSSKTLDYSHLTAFVLGKDFASNPYALREFVQYTKEQYQISKNVYVFLAPAQAKEIVTFSEVDKGIGSYLQELYRNHIETSQKEAVTLGKLITEENNREISILIPRIAIYNNSLAIQGLGIIKDSNYYEELTGEEAKYADLLLGFGKGSRFFLQETSETTNQYVIRVTGVRRSVDISVQNGKPYVTIGITMDGELEKGFEVYQGMSIHEREAKVKGIEAMYAQELKEALTNQFMTITNEKRLDYLNIFQMTRYKNRELYEFYKEDITGFLYKMVSSIEVTVALN